MQRVGERLLRPLLAVLQLWDFLLRQSFAKRLCKLKCRLQFGLI